MVKMLDKIFVISCKYNCRLVIYNFVISAFFVATQFFFTICFVGMLIAIALVLMYLLCIDDYYRVKVLRWIGFDLIVGGKLHTKR